MHPHQRAMDVSDATESSPSCCRLGEMFSAAVFQIEDEALKMSHWRVGLQFLTLFFSTEEKKMQKIHLPTSPSEQNRTFIE